MELTAIEIFKHLPNENCGECGVPTCLAFAMKLAQKQASLDECPRVTDEMRAALEGQSAPPMRTVKIGAGERACEIGGETSLFRHEEKFYRPCGIAVEFASNTASDELKQRIEELNELEFDRVGMMFGLDLVALRDMGDGSLVGATEAAAEVSALPLVLMSEDPAVMGEALQKSGDKPPLIYAATAENLEAMVALAKQHSCPLAIKAAGLEQLAELSEKAAEEGVEDLVLDSGARASGEVLRHQTIIRRAALKKFRAFGYPTICFPASEDQELRVLQACSYIAKYAGIVVVDFMDRPSLLTLITERLNIYTDPQKPLQVEAGIHEVGEPNAESPVLTTTNFSLTYYIVEGDVSSGKVPAWIVTVDTEGTSVLTAWAAETFTPESIAQTLEKSGIGEKVSHKKVIIPGGVAVLKGKLEEASGWEVLVGPRESSGIPAYLREQGYHSG